ncbi:MAG: hypothetical protein ABFD25_00430 [Clostridiaceae bacterium]
MPGKKKSGGNRFIIAVKNYNETIHKLKEGAISLSADKTVYLKLLESQNVKVDNLNDLRKFIRTNKKAPKDVSHYWEGLIIDGYTLMNVEYSETRPSIDQLCRNEIIKFICTA